MKGLHHMELEIEAYPAPFNGKVVRVHIATNYRHGKLAYALRYFNGDEEKIFVGWIWSDQRPRAQMMASHAMLISVALYQKNVRIELVMRSEYLRDRDSMAETKREKKRDGEDVTATKEDEYPWVEFNILRKIYVRGITRARTEADKAVLSRLERRLEDLAYRFPSPLRGENEVQPEIADVDISEFPAEDE